MSTLAPRHTAALVTASALALAACSARSGTGGAEVRVSMAIESESWPAGEGRFTTATGWEVQLETALIALGPIYLWENPPPIAAHQQPGDALARVSEWIVGTAHAHPGDLHFNGGEVRAEFVDQVVFDALAATPLDLKTIDATEGVARAFSVVLDPPRGTASAAALSNHHAYVTGTATKGEVAVPFAGGLDIPNEGTLRRVDGIATEIALVEGARAVLVVHVQRWFRDADFASLTLLDADGRYVITPESQVRTAWFIGARSFDSYTLQRGD